MHRLQYPSLSFALCRDERIAMGGDGEKERPPLTYLLEAQTKILISDLCFVKGVRVPGARAGRGRGLGEEGGLEKGRGGRGYCRVGMERGIESGYRRVGGGVGYRLQKGGVRHTVGGGYSMVVVARLQKRVGGRGRGGEDASGRSSRRCSMA